MSTPNAPLTFRDMIEPAIMAACGWVNTSCRKDYGGNDRMVMGIRAPGTAAPYKYKGE